MSTQSDRRRLQTNVTNVAGSTGSGIGSLLLVSPVTFSLVCRRKRQVTDIDASHDI